MSESSGLHDCFGHYKGFNYIMGNALGGACTQMWTEPKTLMWTRPEL